MTEPYFRATLVPWAGVGDAPQEVTQWLERATADGLICRDPALFHKANGEAFFYLQAFSHEYVDAQAQAQEALQQAAAIRAAAWAKGQQTGPAPGSAAQLRAYLESGGKRR